MLVPVRIVAPAGKPLNLLDVCIQLRITFLSPKKYFAHYVRSLDYKHRSKLLVNNFFEKFFKI
jgi:hypothetical protein